MKNTQKMIPLPVTSSATVKLNYKVVDFRKEKAIIRDLAYLTGNIIHIGLCRAIDILNSCFTVGVYSTHVYAVCVLTF